MGCGGLLFKGNLQRQELGTLLAHHAGGKMSWVVAEPLELAGMSMKKKKEYSGEFLKL